MKLIFKILMVISLFFLGVFTLLFVFLQSDLLIVENRTGSDICIHQAGYGISKGLTNTQIVAGENESFRGYLSFSKSLSLSYEEGQCTDNPTELRCEVKAESDICAIFIRANGTLVCDQCYD